MTTAIRDHVTIDPAILYFGTPVVLLSTTNPDGSANLAPFSSAFWLGDRAILGVSRSSQTWGNLTRTGEVVIALPSDSQVDAVNRLALKTGNREITATKVSRGYTHLAHKFEHSGLTPVPADQVAPPTVAECPFALECVVESMVADTDRTPVVEARVLQVHAHPEVLMAGRPNRIDPDRWRPLIMSFQQLYGLAPRTASSRLATVDEDLYR